MTPYLDLREQVAQFALRMHDCGLVVGTSGNVSARVAGEDLFVITPSSMPYPQIRAEDVVVMNMEGDVLSEGRAPSFEANLHRNIYLARPDVGSIFHTHSPYASALAVLRKPLPAALEELVVFFGGPVEVSEYAPGGSEEVVRNACKALGDRAAFLLANHGPVCVGRDLETGLKIAQLLEQVAQIYVIAMTAGTPTVLPADVIETQKSIYDYMKEDK